MVDYAGWDMPVQYPAGPATEAKACRGGAGIFDVSHMGEIRVIGEEALDFVQYCSSNDAAKLQPGAAQYSLLLNAEGGVKDDIIVYRIDASEFLIVVNAGCKDKDWEWLSQKSAHFRVTLADESDRTALIAVQGPEAPALVARLARGYALPGTRFRFGAAKVAGAACMVARTGYTGEDGFELFCAPDDAPGLWAALLDAGASACGLAARDILRIEAAYPLYGHELAEETSPMGSGLQWAVKMYKKDFIGRNAMVVRSQAPLREVLAGIKISGDAKAIPREGCELFAPNVAASVGYVTSGTLSPTLGCGIALVHMGRGWAEPGKQLELDIRGRRVPVEVVNLPFYRNGV